jgi:hypothetical protein
MRVLFTGFLLLALASGCASRKIAPAAYGHLSGTYTNTTNRLIVTPENPLVGTVVRVNSEARFVVLNFPIGQMPKFGQSFSVYRQGLKVGELRITGPQRDDDTIADIVVGDAAVNDTARQQ